MTADTAAARVAAAYHDFLAADAAFEDARIAGNVAEMNRLAEVAEAAADAYDIAFRDELIARGGFCGIVAGL